MDNITEKITCTVTETEEAFVFNTIRNFVKDQCQIEINKNDLISAIKLKQVCDSIGLDIYDLLYKVMDYKCGYIDGHIEGLTKANDTLESLINIKNYTSTIIKKLKEEIK